MTARAGVVGIQALKAWVTTCCHMQPPIQIRSTTCCFDWRANPAVMQLRWQSQAGAGPGLKEGQCQMKWVGTFMWDNGSRACCKKCWEMDTVMYLFIFILSIPNYTPCVEYTSLVMLLPRFTAISWLTPTNLFQTCSKSAWFNYNKEVTLNLPFELQVWRLKF